jgi:putative ABC transport system permease protein
MNTTIALRNLSRNRWRTLLTAGGIAVATAMLIWTDAMQESFLVRMVDSAIGVRVGHLQVHAEAYVEDAILYHSFPEDSALTEAIDDIAAITATAPRVYGYGIIGHETRSQAGQFVGVDPARERLTSSAPEQVREGRWLSDTPAATPGPREVVLGYELAERLRVTVGDELVALTQGANGSLGNDLLKVVGLLNTGNTLIDRMSAYLHLEDARYLLALEGRLHELSLQVGPDTDQATLEEVAQVLKRACPQVGSEDKMIPLTTRTWQQVVPEMYTIVEMARSQIWIMYLIIFLIAGLGILNTQRMSAMERRREFGVLLAIGLAPSALARIVLYESVLVSFLGGLIGLGLGAVGVGYHATYGMDIAAMADQGGESFSYMGYSFSEPLFFEMTANGMLPPVLIITIVGFICGLWPALVSARLDAIRAIAGRS